MILYLSQHLLKDNRYTISIPGEAENYFGECQVTGETEHIPIPEVWYALTEKALEVWEGKKKKVENRKDGSVVTLGRLYQVEL